MKPSQKAIEAACKAVKLALDNCWATSVGYLDHALDEAYKIDVDLLLAEKDVERNLATRIVTKLRVEGNSLRLRIKALEAQIARLENQITKNELDHELGRRFARERIAELESKLERKK